MHEVQDLVDRQNYRDAMARLGAAVSVITSDGPAGRCAFTASAVCSVTDDPPTLLVCMNRNSDSNEAFRANAVLCVNTLAASQEPLSALFAGFTHHTMDQRFDQAVWTTMVSGAPVLADAVVSFDCRIAQVSEVGTHNVFFCEVQAIQSGSAHEGLIYFGRSYHRITVAA
ncbi:MAG: flavin reductase [Gemmatimonadaceae bacterium]|nr:flavin reductase [Acetobacteraceae bacterium]